MSLIIVSGPTASGKSHLADVVYGRYPVRIINADSIQMYDALPVLTAQPDDLKNSGNKYSLYASFRFDQKCTVAKWVELAAQEIQETTSMGKVPLLVGGTGLYLKALLYGIVDIPDIDDDVRVGVRARFDILGKENFYMALLDRDPGISVKVHANDTSRMIRAMEVLEQTGKSILSFKENKQRLYKGKVLHVSLFPEREKLYQWCDERFDKMLAVGAIDEVEEFMKLTSITERCNKHPVEYALGYEELMRYISGNMSLEDAKVLAKQKTRNYAKRQVTWFRHQFSNQKIVVYDSAETSNFIMAGYVREFMDGGF